ncbi:Peptidase S24-like [Cohaesibacter sp. ES.047]|uniref:S24 family peptidase n=1 Tax=Cohaesibacter sp. ES.047 TaxID=1798205 RepID=UPI000BB7B8D0|nr:S24 family peptidase [Cohaesibacter sp. ES.047]SNY93391.1 Peptidase S24-like [Cohaesibacter sp. ES.047]
MARDTGALKEKAKRLFVEIEAKFDASPSRIAKLAGFAPSTLNKSLNDPDYRPPSSKTLSKVLAWLRTRDLDLDGAQKIASLKIQADMASLMSDIIAWESDGFVSSHTRDIVQMVKAVDSKAAGSSYGHVPVFGTAAGSVFGAMQLEEGMQVDHIERPAGLRSSPHAYALKVVGESMSPKFEPGDLIFADPHRRVDIGDVVVIQTKNFNKFSDDPVQAYIKFFKGITDKKLLAHQLNPALDIEYTRKTEKDNQEIVYAYHRVLSVRELFDV